MKGKYLGVGIGVYLIELLVILIAQNLGASTFLAVALSFWVGLFFSFLLQKFVTFQDRRTHYKVVLSQVIAVVMLVLFNFGFTLVCAHFLSKMLPAFIIRAGAIGITSIWNFYLYKSRIFKNQDTILID
jgi:putative flippase GtrA